MSVETRCWEDLRLPPLRARQGHKWVPSQVARLEMRVDKLRLSSSAMVIEPGSKKHQASYPRKSHADTGRVLLIMGLRGVHPSE